MKNQDENKMSAIELRDIMANQLRSLDKSDITDKLIGRKIDLAKQIFNGAGKMIALAAYTTEANRMGLKSDILLLPEPEKKLLKK